MSLFDIIPNDEGGLDVPGEQELRPMRTLKVRELKAIRAERRASQEAVARDISRPTAA